MEMVVYGSANLTEPQKESIKNDEANAQIAMKITEKDMQINEFNDNILELKKDRVAWIELREKTQKKNTEQLQRIASVRQQQMIVNSDRTAQSKKAYDLALAKEQSTQENSELDLTRNKNADKATIAAYDHKIAVLNDAISREQALLAKENERTNTANVGLPRNLIKGYKTSNERIANLEYQRDLEIERRNQAVLNNASNMVRIKNEKVLRSQENYQITNKAKENYDISQKNEQEYTANSLKTLQAEEARMNNDIAIINNNVKKIDQDIIYYNELIAKKQMEKKKLQELTPDYINVQTSYSAPNVHYSENDTVLEKYKKDWKGFNRSVFGAQY